MKKLCLLFALPFFISSFTTTTMTDKFEVWYDSKLVGKEGIKLMNGKSLQVVNASGGKVYKLEVLVALPKRSCYQKTYENAEAAKPIPVAPLMSAACADASRITLTINMNTFVNIPLLK